MMEIKDKLTEKDLEDLRLGKVRYFVTSHEKIGYGHKQPWWKVFFWNTTHRSDKLSYDYPFFYNHYKLTTAVSGTGLGIRLDWDDTDMERCTNEMGLQEGDKVTVFFKAFNSRGKPWCAGGTHYVIEKNGWKEIGRIKGA